MKRNDLTIGVLFLLVFACAPKNLHSMEEGPRGLTQKEQEDILQKCQPPQDIKEKLDKFFADDNVRCFYQSREKIKLRHRASQQVQQENIDIIRNFYRGDVSFTTLNKIKLEYNLKFPVNYQMTANPLQNYMILMKQYRVFYFDDFPKYMIKINTRDWPLKYQSVSRVFYNEKIKEAIQNFNLQHIYLLEEYLYHIPGRPNEICDANYIVIAKRIPNLPDVNQNKKTFTELVDDWGYENPEYEDVLTEIVQVVTYCGLWNITPRSVFIKDGYVAFIDLEEPGLGGSDPKWLESLDNEFFHKNPKKVSGDANGGFDGVCQLLKGR